MKNYEKDHDRSWDNYPIDDLRWTNINRDYLCREKYIDYIKDQKIKNIVEIGAGELIEAQFMLNQNIVDEYSIVDVSKVFLEMARGIDGINAYEGNMIDIPAEDKKFDLIYCNSVLEHSPDIRRTIKEMSRVSNRFYFNMFKWKMKSGDLTSYFNKKNLTYYFKNKRGYYTTSFNIDQLFELISVYGQIEKLVIYGGTEEEDPFEQLFNDYRNENSDIDENWNKNYLCIYGEWS